MREGLDPVWLILIGSALIHAVGLAWTGRHEAARALDEREAAVAAVLWWGIRKKN